MFDAELSLEGKVALVSGAGRGLGHAMALGLAEAGAAVAAVSRTTAEVKAAAAEVAALGRRGLAITADMTCSEAVDGAVARVVGELGRIDILVNAAGGSLRKPITETSDEEWEGAIRLNLTSAFFTCRAAGRHFLAQRSGRVINVASTAGLRGRPNLASYCASKAALINFSRALAVEWAPYGVRVNVLCPGRFRTPATAPEMDDPAQYQAFIQRVPLGRIGSPEELKLAAVFLSSRASDFATGTVLVLDGGQTVP